jgi:hypothetical protein
MFPDSAFPGPLPLCREAALDLLARLNDFGSTGGSFLSFVMIPLEERALRPSQAPPVAWPRPHSHAR